VPGGGTEGGSARAGRAGRKRARSLLRLAAGLEKPQTGKIRVAEEDMTGRDHHAYRAKGVTFLPAGRLEEGLMPGLTITEHFALQQQKGL